MRAIRAGEIDLQSGHLRHMTVQMGGDGTFGEWMQNRLSCIFLGVGYWTINRRSVALLLGVLIAILLVLVLPQVDLLDVAFHLGTAPILVHSTATGRPAFQTVSVLLAFFLPQSEVVDHKSHCLLRPISIYKIQKLHHFFRC